MRISQVLLSVALISTATQLSADLPAVGRHDVSQPAAPRTALPQVGRHDVSEPAAPRTALPQVGRHDVSEPAAPRTALPQVGRHDVSEPAAPRTALPPADDTIAKTPPPAEVTIEEQIGGDLSKLVLVDENGKNVTLGQLADGKRPVIIAPVYYNCPHLCTLTLNGLLQAIEKENRYALGKDYLVVAYSFHPDEKHQLAQVKQKNYLRKLTQVTDQNLDGYISHWRFFTGSIENIAAISKAIGFRYLKETSTNPRKKDVEYVHPAALIVTTPDLKVSRYLYGVEYAQTDYRLALLEAADGKVSKTIGDRLMLTCYSFDPVKRKYSLVAWRVMRLGGIATLILVVLLLGVLWYRERLKRAKA